MHIVYAGPFMGHTFLKAGDAQSKWPEVVCINSINSAHTVEVLRLLLSNWLTNICLNNSQVWNVVSEKNWLKMEAVLVASECCGILDANSSLSRLANRKLPKMYNRQSADWKLIKPAKLRHGGMIQSPLGFFFISNFFRG